jgi:hypothetical protein
MIIATQRNGAWTFLDGTANSLPLGYPSSFIQEKEALIGISPDSFVIAQVPVVPMEKNFRTNFITCTLKDEDLSGSGVSTYGGLWRNVVSNNYSDVSEKKRPEELCKMLRTGNNKCVLDSVRYEGLDAYEDTLSFHYTMSILAYARKIDKKIYVNLNLDRDLEDEKVDLDKQKTEQNYRFKYVIHEVVVLNIPAGYSVLELPGNSIYKGKAYGYEISFQSTPGKVQLDKKIYFDELLKMNEQFDDWNAMIKKLNDAYSEAVVLQQN